MNRNALPACAECDQLTARMNHVRAHGGHYALRKIRQDKEVHARFGACPRVLAIRARLQGLA
ncbi:hypothetical protein ACWCYY_18445 [Kitasatospora sp. NPDC001664]